MSTIFRKHVHSQGCDCDDALKKITDQYLSYTAITSYAVAPIFIKFKTDNIDILKSISAKVEKIFPRLKAKNAHLALTILTQARFLISNKEKEQKRLEGGNNENAIFVLNPFKESQPKDLEIKIEREQKATDNLEIEQVKSEKLQLIEKNNLDIQQLYDEISKTNFKVLGVSVTIEEQVPDKQKSDSKNYRKKKNLKNPKPDYKLIRQIEKHLKLPKQIQKDWDKPKIAKIESEKPNIAKIESEKPKNAKVSNELASTEINPYVELIEKLQEKAKGAIKLSEIPLYPIEGKLWEQYLEEPTSYHRFLCIERAFEIYKNERFSKYFLEPDEISKQQIADFIVYAGQQRELFYMKFAEECFPCS